MQFSGLIVAYRGIETLDVSVQVHMSNGLPSMAVVGLADKAVAKPKERVRAAPSSLGLALPAKRIAVNLSPADLLKEGAHFDLPIAMGLLAAMGVLPSDCLNEHILLGELALDSSVRRVTGILPAALHAKANGRHPLYRSAGKTGPIGARVSQIYSGCPYHRRSCR